MGGVGFPIRKVVSAGYGHSEDWLYRLRVATRINSTCALGSGDRGGNGSAIPGGSGAWKTGRETCIGGCLSLSVSPGESGPVSLSVASAATTRLAFARQLVGSSLWRS